jgi:hypothetical protein
LVIRATDGRLLDEPIAATLEFEAEFDRLPSRRAIT